MVERERVFHETASDGHAGRGEPMKKREREGGGVLLTVYRGGGFVRGVDEWISGHVFCDDLVAWWGGPWRRGDAGWAGFFFFE